MALLLRPVRLGDRRRSAPAWLILCEGSLRGILSQGEDDEIILAVACDRRIQTADPMRFSGLTEAHAWVSRRLNPRAARWVFGNAVGQEAHCGSDCGRRAHGDRV